MLTLTRQQIARIVGNDPVAIQAFEAILSGSLTDVPQNSQDADINSATAEARAGAVAQAIADLAQALAAQPPAQETAIAGDVGPSSAASLAGPSLADLAPSAIGGASGAFTTSDPFTVTVVDGRIVSIA